MRNYKYAVISDCGTYRYELGGIIDPISPLLAQGVGDYLNRIVGAWQDGQQPALAWRPWAERPGWLCARPDGAHHEIGKHIINADRSLTFCVDERERPYTLCVGSRSGSLARRPHQPSLPLDDQQADRMPSGLFMVRIILWIMLNPSTADGESDDQTLRTIVKFSEIWGYTEILVGNLYAFRTKDPKVLARAMKDGTDVVGPRNNIHLTQMVDRVRRTNGEVMAAWGGNAKHDRVREVQDIAGEMRCLRLNSDGSPVHPLYQSHDLMPTIWAGMPA